MGNKIINLINEVISEAYLNEEKIEDFFNFLENDPKKNTFAYAYYTAPVGVNKNIVGKDGQKSPNPMFGKLLKHSVVKFNYNDTYKRAVERKEEKTGTQHTSGERSGTYDKVQGYDVLETGKSGLYLPVITLDTKSTYSYDNDGNWGNIDYDKVKPYLKTYKPSGFVQNYRQLIVDRISKLNAGGKNWTNPNFKYGGIGQ